MELANKQKITIDGIRKAAAAKGGEIISVEPVRPDSDTALVWCKTPDRQVTFQVAVDGSAISHTIGVYKK